MEYAKQRQQFGVPIGSFQALAHGLADVATAVDGAQLLAREAAWAADEGEPDAAALAPHGVPVRGRAAQQATAAALHVHGGYGFMQEYDIQLYLPAGQGVAARCSATRGAVRCTSPTRCRTGAGGGPLMDFRLGARSDAVPRRGPRVPRASTSPTSMVERGPRHRHLARLGPPPGARRAGLDRGVAGPRSTAGRAATRELTAMRDELRLAGVPTDGLGQSIIVAAPSAPSAPTEQKQTVLPPAAGRRVVFALGYTEPDSGSDVAAAQTRAVRDGDDWLIDGQKMFTTLAARGRVRVPARPHGPRRAQAPAASRCSWCRSTRPGVELQPVRTLGRRAHQHRPSTPACAWPTRGASARSTAAGR